MKVVLPLLLAGCTAPFLPEQGEEAEGIILIFHGSNDDPSVWADALVTVMGAGLDAPERWDIVAYDWSDQSDSRTSAARRGRRLGRRLAAILTEERDYQSVHAIGHSVGAHPAAGLVDAIEGPRQQLTLLDPFGGLGMARWGYGRRSFGEGADFTDAYLNIGDGVPSTEDFPQLACGFDVTALIPADYPADEAHWWPVDFYLASIGSGAGLDLAMALDGDRLWPACEPGTHQSL